MAIAVLGIDLGKNSCSVVGLDGSGAVVLRRRLHRENVIKLASDLAPCVMAMEVCCGAHHLGRILRDQGHQLAFGNLDDFIAVQDDGTVAVDFGTATREQVASLSGLEIDEYSEGRGDSAKPVRRVKLKFSEKRQALMDLAKLTRMMPADRVEHSGGVQVQHKA